MTAGQNQNCKLGAVDYCQNPVTVKQRLGLVEGEGSNFVNQCHQETAELFYVVLCLQPCQSIIAKRPANHFVAFTKRSKRLRIIITKYVSWQTKRDRVCILSSIR